MGEDLFSVNRLYARALVQSAARGLEPRPEQDHPRHDPKKGRLHSPRHRRGRAVRVEAEHGHHPGLDPGGRPGAERDHHGQEEAERKGPGSGDSLGAGLTGLVDLGAGPRHLTRERGPTPDTFLALPRAPVRAAPPVGRVDPGRGLPVLQASTEFDYLAAFPALRHRPPPQGPR